jgi:hypothetical protein
MDKKVYVLVYLNNGYDNENASSDVYATKESAEPALQEERESLISDYKGWGWKIKDDYKDKVVITSFDYSEFVEVHIEGRKIEV